MASVLFWKNPDQWPCRLPHVLDLSGCTKQYVDATLFSMLYAGGVSRQVVPLLVTLNLAKVVTLLLRKSAFPFVVNDSSAG